MNIDIEKVIELVKETKKIIVNEDYRSQIDEKGYGDFVTKVDLEVQNYLYGALKELYPQVGFVGEEEGVFVETDEPTWILDPIDGTANLVYDYRWSAVSLGLCVDNEIVMGVIYNPYTDDIFQAEKGNGAYLNKKPIRVSPKRTLRDSLVAIGTTPYEKEETDANFAIFKDIYRNCLDIRRSGSAALDLAYVACGRLDAFFEKKLKPWDFAAGLILIQEAGGKVTAWDGSPLHFSGPDNVIATNGYIHGEVYEKINR